MEHLSLEIFDLSGTGSKYASLPEDTTITIIDTSEIFGSGDVWSYNFTLNVQANAHIFGSAGDMHGSRLHEQINKRRARLWVEGLPLYFGYLKLGEEVEVDEEGNVDVSFDSGNKMFDDMVEGAKANQVPLMSDVQIGMALWRKRWVHYKISLTALATCTIDGKEITFSGDIKQGGNDVFDIEYDGEDEGSSLQQYPRMVFPKGQFRNTLTGSDENVDFLNTDYPYDAGHPYCNVALCYQRTGYEKKNQEGGTYYDYSSEPEAQRGYEVMPANRVNSAPNFFVIYWIRSLMKHLGIYIEENQMMDVEDLRRLFFVNTKCNYEEPDVIRNNSDSRFKSRYGRYRFSSAGRLIAEHFAPKTVVKIADSGFVNSSSFVNEYSDAFPITQVTAKIKEVKEWSEVEKAAYIDHNSYLHKAFATRECFPDIDILEVIKAIESGFGIRFLFSDNYQRVRIVLLRNIFRSEEVQTINCDIISETKTENSIRGFRMTYGDSEDTAFYYKGFADMMPHKKPYFIDTSDKHDYSHWNLSADYGSLIHKISAFDKTCYVTPNTGDAFGIKVDKNAKRYDELHPSLFEYAAFMDAEDGDCTGEEETIETINVGFAPAIMNDVNFEKERNEGIAKQQFALFVDETMRPRREDLKDGTDYNNPDAVYSVTSLYSDESPAKYMKSDDGIVKPGEFAITSDMFASESGLAARMYGTKQPYKAWGPNISSLNIDGHINEGYRLYLQDNFEPNDDGVSPIETHDWGLTLGIMRGSGADRYVKYEHDPDDQEDNSTWEIVPGSSVTAHPDTCDNYGNEWDYNGSFVVTPITAIAKLQELFPNSDAPFNDANLGYITNTTWINVSDSTGRRRVVLLATEYSIAGVTVSGSGDIRYFVQLTLDELLELSRTTRHMVIEVDSSDERGSTLVQLCKFAYGGGQGGMIIDNGVGSRYGRFSLKLRAEKPNPEFDPMQVESSYNRRYLPITNENLRRRGLCDQFYKEYSYWVRNARIAKREVRMELAQFLAIDKTKKATVGDITGFIRKMQFTVSNNKGLGTVSMEIMYI